MWRDFQFHCRVGRVINQKQLEKCNRKCSCLQHLSCTLEAIIPLGKRDHDNVQLSVDWKVVYSYDNVETVLIQPIFACRDDSQGLYESRNLLKLPSFCVCSVESCSIWLCMLTCSSIYKSKAPSRQSNSLAPPLGCHIVAGCSHHTALACLHQDDKLNSTASHFLINCNPKTVK